jgi:hypothetical protein
MVVALGCPQFDDPLGSGPLGDLVVGVEAMVRILPNRPWTGIPFANYVRVQNPWSERPLSTFHGESLELLHELDTEIQEIVAAGRGTEAEQLWDMLRATLLDNAIPNHRETLLAAVGGDPELRDVFYERVTAARQIVRLMPGCNYRLQCEQMVRTWTGKSGQLFSTAAVATGLEDNDEVRRIVLNHKTVARIVEE